MEKKDELMKEMKELMEGFGPGKGGIFSVWVRKESRHGGRRSDFVESKQYERNGREGIRFGRKEYGFTIMNVPLRDRQGDGLDMLDLEKGDVLYSEFHTAKMEEKKDGQWEDKDMGNFEKEWLERKGIEDGEVLVAWTEKIHEEARDVNEILQMKMGIEEAQVMMDCESRGRLRKFVSAVGYRDGKEYMISTQCGFVSVFVMEDDMVLKVDPREQRYDRFFPSKKESRKEKAI